MKRVCLFDSRRATPRGLQRMIHNFRKKYGSLEVLQERAGSAMTGDLETMLDDLVVWRAAEATLRDRQQSLQNNGRRMRERKT